MLCVWICHKTSEQRLQSKLSLKEFKIFHDNSRSGFLWLARNMSRASTLTFPSLIIISRSMMPLADFRSKKAFLPKVRLKMRALERNNSKITIFQSSCKFQCRRSKKKLSIMPKSWQLCKMSWVFNFPDANYNRLRSDNLKGLTFRSHTAFEVSFDFPQRKAYAVEASLHNVWKSLHKALIMP